MNTINVYNAKELKEQFPDAYDKAFENYKNASPGHIPWSFEIEESMKKCFDCAGITLKGWSIGVYDRCYVKFNLPTYWSELADCDMLVDDYEGRRAYKWLKETFGLKSYRRVEYVIEGKKKFRYGFVKIDGKDWSCEFTGYCADHDFMDSLFDDIHSGMNLKDAFHNLANVAGKIMEAELEYDQSEEAFLEMSESNEWEYTEDGVQI